VLIHLFLAASLAAVDCVAGTNGPRDKGDGVLFVGSVGRFLGRLALGGRKIDEAAWSHPSWRESFVFGVRCLPLPER